MDSYHRIVVKADQAPAAIGPYSVAIAAGPLVYTSGQLGIDPLSNNIVPGGIEAETRQTLNNLREVLKAAESSIEKVVKTTVFLRDMNDFAIMNSIYAEYFIENPPARTTVQVAALPKNAAIEIEAVALRENDAHCKD